MNLITTKSYTKIHIPKFITEHRCISVGIASLITSISVTLIHQGLVNRKLDDVKIAVGALLTPWNKKNGRPLLIEVGACLALIGLIPGEMYFDVIQSSKNNDNDSGGTSKGGMDCGGM